MYDTVHFFLSKDNIDGDIYSTRSFLSKVYDRIDQEGFIYVSGYFKNLKVHISPSGILFSGSLCKYYLGNNLDTLNLNTVKLAIDSLSFALKLPIQKAEVFRIDIAANIELKLPIKVYLKKLGFKPYFERVLKSNGSLAYETKKKELAFYDKIKEMKTHKAKIPQGFNLKNILRFELRFLRKIKKQLNEDRLVIEMLYDELFYAKITNLWFEEYISISKLSDFNFDISNIKTPKDVIYPFLGFLCPDVDAEQVIQYIEYLKQQKTFDDPKEYTRAKQYINDFIKKLAPPISNSTISELDNKIEQVYLCSRNNCLI